MANNKIQVRRTSVSGRTANVTSSGNSQYIDAGELALNMADGILYSSNGSSLITVGANLVNARVTGTATINSVSATTISGNGSSITSVNAAFLNAISSAQFLRSDTTDSIDNANFLQFSAPTTTYISPASVAVVNAPFGAREWHDLLAFNRNFTTTFELYDGAVWASNTVDLDLFAQKENQTKTIITGSTYTNARWTWTGTAWSSASWVAIGITYTPIYGARQYTVESSADNITWTIRHQSTSSLGAVGSDVIYLPLSSYSGDNYLRLTITRSDTNDLKLSFISLLTSRSGDQGRGREQELPFSWDGSKNITLEANTTANGNIVAGSGFGGASAGLTVNSSIVGVSTNTTVNSTYTSSLLQVANSSGNVQHTATSIKAQTNTTVNSTMTASLVQISNSTSTANLSAIDLVIGVTTANSTALKVGNTTITTTNAILGGTLTANGGLGTSGQVLTSGGAGNVYWSTVSGGTSNAVYMKGGAATIGTLAAGGSNIFRVNANTLSYDTTIESGENAQATGPLAIASGITLTISSGARVAIS